MSILSIRLPSNTFLTNGKHITFKAPCDSKGVTGLRIGDDDQVYELQDSRNRPVSGNVVVFNEDVMVHVILDVSNHIAYLQTASGSTSSGGVSGVTDFNGREGSVTPQSGDYTAEMVSAASVTHASQHASSGLDPITPESIGAATADHDHGNTYALLVHSHNDYSLTDHNHNGVYAAATHDHDGVYAPFNHSHGENGEIGFNQDDADQLYAKIDHIHTLSELGAAAEDHTHTIDDISDDIATKAYVDSKIPTELKNPNAFSINGVTYDGSVAIDFTSIINAMIDAKLAETATYEIAYSLTNVESSNIGSSVFENASFDTTLSSADGYILEKKNIVVTMGGTDVSDTVVTMLDDKNAKISISNVTGEIVISAFGTQISYSVTYNVDEELIFGNTSASVLANASYTTTITPIDGYTLGEVKIMMSDDDITTSAYSINSDGVGTIDIAKVTGNVVITARAAQLATDNPVFYISDTNETMYEYSFEEGMTWDEFVASEHNDESFSFDEEVTVMYNAESVTETTWSNVLSYNGKLILIGEFDSTSVESTIFIAKDEAVAIEAGRTYIVLDQSDDSGDSGDDSEGTDTYTVTFNVTNIEYQGATTAAKDSTYEATLTAMDGYVIDNDSVVVKMRGAGQADAYYASSGKIFIDQVIGDIEISATAILTGGGGSDSGDEPVAPTPNTYSVTVNSGNFVFDGANTATEGTDYTATIAAADGYEIESVTVVVDGNQIGSFTFINGELTISGEDVTGDIVINVATIEEIVEPEGPEESTLWIYEYGKDSLSNGELIDNPRYSNIVKQGITYNYDGGYLFVHKNTLASGADNIPSMIIGGINLVDYDKIYIEYICKLGSTVSPTHPEDHLYIGYGETTSINSTAFTDYVSEWNTLNVQRAEFDISGITDSSIQYYIKAVFEMNLSAENTGIKIKNIWLERLASEDGGDEEEPETPIEPEEPEANTYNVIVNTGNFAFYGENTATSGVDYVATITANDDCFISSVESTIDNKQIGNYSNGTLTIPGTDITGDINIAISTEYIEYEITHNYTNCESDNKLRKILVNSNYAANIIPNDGFEVNSVTIKMGETDVTEDCGISYENGIASFTTRPVTGNLTIEATAVKVEQENEAIYLFDSSREDNFIFGKYRYSDKSGVVMPEASTSWPPANSDGINTSSNCIILSGGNGGTMDLGEPTFLYLEDNSSGLSEEGMLCNNVKITLGGKEYEPRRAGIPFGTYTLKVKGYKTGTKSDGFVDYGNDTYDKLILINSTSEQTYEAEIEIVKNGRFQFASTSGSGDVVITDIWLEEIK